MSLKEKILNVFKFFSTNQSDKHVVKHGYDYTTENNGYIVEDNGYILTFKKNGVIHREAGPAVFWTINTNTKKYLNLEDKYLYKIKVKELSLKEQDFWATSMYFGNMNDVSYYLNGTMYEKDEFDNILKRKNLNDELKRELIIKPNLTKKLKI